MQYMIHSGDSPCYPLLFPCCLCHPPILPDIALYRIHDYFVLFSTELTRVIYVTTGLELSIRAWCAQQ